MRVLRISTEMKTRSLVPGLIALKLLICYSCIIVLLSTAKSSMKDIFGPSHVRYLYLYFFFCITPFGMSLKNILRLP